jgi:RND family efflux transporter MFP subunit
MAQTDSLRIFVNVPQAYVASIAPGLKTEVAVREFPQKHFIAQVANLAGALDPVTRTMLTEVRMTNEGELLRPGTYADVKFQLTRKEPPLIVPASALIFRSGQPRVATVVGANKVRFQIVQLGRDYGASIEVVDGLSEKDRLLIAPPDDLQDGDTVRVTETRTGKNGEKN